MFATKSRWANCASRDSSNHLVTEANETLTQLMFLLDPSPVPVANICNFFVQCAEDNAILQLLCDLENDKIGTGTRVNWDKLIRINIDWVVCQFKDSQIVNMDLRNMRSCVLRKDTKTSVEFVG